MANIFEESCKLPQESRDRMLYDAFGSKNENLINLAIASGAQLDYSALEAAVRLNYVGVIKTILEKGKVLSSKEKKANILTFSIKEPEVINPSCLTLLIEHGALVTKEAFIQLKIRISKGVATDTKKILTILVEHAKIEDVTCTLFELMHKR